MTHWKKPSFIDLFAGIGGIRMALDQAGFDCVYSNEINPSAAQTYSKNFGEIDVRDIRKVPEQMIPKHDVLCAGFPCQPFSRAGVSARSGLSREHGFKDKEQGKMFFQITRIVRFHQPSAIFLENVANLLKHDGGRTIKRIFLELDKLGYNPKFQIFDASLVVPHRRKRIYIVALKKPFAFEFPVIEQRQHRLKDILEKRLGDKHTISDKLWASHIARTARNKKKGNGFAHHIADLNGIASTLTARYGKDGRENLIPQPGKNPRMLSPRECARLMGFPDDFELPETKTPAYRQLGNSVCVPIVRIIAESLREQLDESNAVNFISIPASNKKVLVLSH